MPLVLTQNEETESGHDYRDVLGRATSSLVDTSVS